MKSIEEEKNLNGKRILLRLDLNVPLDNGKILDATRIDKILPTLKFLISQNTKIIILSHVGRPKGKIINELSLKPICEDLGNKLNKNVKRLARKSALTKKANEKAITVLEDFNFETPKTQNFTALLNALGLQGKKSLFVLGASNNNVYLSSRNLKGSDVITSSELSTYKILNANQVILLESSLEGIESNLSK